MDAMEDTDGGGGGGKRRVHVEVQLKRESVADYEQVRVQVAYALAANASAFSAGSVAFPASSALAEHVARIAVTEIDGGSSTEEDVEAVAVPREGADLQVHVFKLSNEPPADETAEDDDSAVTTQQLVLPSASLDGLWESLVYDSAVKRSVLDYATTAMLFADAQVNPHLISWNRVVLLHGPPGTGKTSLCKALAQKLSIRLAERYPNAYLLEINAHSLFSKWFSESGKLVMKLFRQIQELVEDGEALICVLIDEVESLTSARKAAASGSDPSDAIRVVNALLTQLDALKQYPNVLVLTTSNITGAIDVAFVDRADIKQYIGPPSTRARYEILRSCVDELQRVGIIRQSQRPVLPYVELLRAQRPRDGQEASCELEADASGTQPDDLELAQALLECAKAVEGFSGRALRKLPFQAHALFAQARSSSTAAFIRALKQAVAQETENRRALASA